MYISEQVNGIHFRTAVEVGYMYMYISIHLTSWIYCVHFHTPEYIIYLDFLPVTRPHGVVLQVSDQRHRSLELIHTVPASFHHFPVFILKMKLR